MKTYTVTIKLITDYIQARFSEKAKEELEQYISKGIVKNEEDSWITLLHKDEKGIYIPAIQIRNAIVNAGRELKYKKTRRSLQQWVISNVMIKPENIYIGKEKPDRVLISYPARKDGNRVCVRHPLFEAGMTITFELHTFDELIEKKAIEELISIAGKMYGIGGRRRDMYGRFELLKLS